MYLYTRSNLREQMEAQIQLAMNSNSSKSGTPISAQAQEMINTFDQKVGRELKTGRFKNLYGSVDEILEKKYQVHNANALDFPDYQEKTDFIVKSVRGNLAKANGHILNYSEAEKLVQDSLNTELP